MLRVTANDRICFLGIHIIASISVADVIRPPWRPYVLNSTTALEISAPIAEAGNARNTFMQNPLTIFVTLFL